jgi:hypothetical protein
MLIRNGEPFIRLDVAAKAYFNVELYSYEPSEIEQEYLIHLASHLCLYTYIYGVCNIQIPENITPSNTVDSLPKFINGMCETEFKVNSDGGAIKNITVSKFTEIIAPQFIGYRVLPVQGDILYQSYLKSTCVYIPEFIKHAKEVGVDISIEFLKVIIFNDSSFIRQRVEKSHYSKMDLKQLSAKYLNYFDGIPKEVIIQAYELACEMYYEMKEDGESHRWRFQYGMENIIQAEVNKNLKNEIIKDGISNISELFLELFPGLPASSENIDLLSNFIPDAWRVQLSNNKILSTGEKSTYFENDDTPDKLYLALSVYNQVWQNFDPTTTNIPKKEQVEEIVKIMGVSEPKDIDAIIRLSIPDGLEFGKRPNANKVKWQPLRERLIKE